jgi:transposase IS66 family protein
MTKLHEWLKAQLAEHKTEPNSGLGKAISHLLNHWTKLTLFLSQPGAPLDNNIATAARGSGDVMPRARLCRAEVAKRVLVPE